MVDASIDVAHASARGAGGLACTNRTEVLVAVAFVQASRLHHGSSASRRRAFTMVEAIVALAIIMIVGIIVVQAVTWGLQQRARTNARHAAIELAANVLEAARAQPAEKLDKSWADAQQAPSDIDAVLPGAKVAVSVEPDAKLPASRRVTVEVTWQFAPEPAKSVRMASVFSTRGPVKGGTP